MYEFVVVSFVGMLIGGGIGYRANKQYNGKIYGLLISCGGMLLGIIGLDIIPHVLHEHDLYGVLLGLMGGILFILTLNKLLNNVFSNKERERENTFYFLVIGMALHNIPNGIVIGLHMYDFAKFQFLLATFVQDIPEGIALFLTALLTTKPVRSFLTMVVLLSAMVLVGIIVGRLVTIPSEGIHALLLGGAIGILSYVTVVEVILKSKKYVSATRVAISLFLGFTVIAIFYI